MESWSLVDWLTISVFLLVTLAGIWNIWRFCQLSPDRRRLFFQDRSVAVRWGLIDVLMVAFAWMASQALSLQLLYYIYGVAPGDETSVEWGAHFTLISGMVQLVVVSLALVALMRRYGHRRSDLGLTKGQFFSGLRWGLIAFSVWIPLVWATQTLLVRFIEYRHPTFDRIQKSEQLVTVVEAWIAAVLIAPLVEEILFRGMLQSWLQRLRRSKIRNPNWIIMGGPISEQDFATEVKPRPIHWPAIMTTSVLFGLAHYSQGPAPYSLFVLSLGLGYLYQRTGSVLACIVVHMLLNTITMCLFTLKLAI